MNNKTMTSQELKKAIAEDIEALKTMEVDIMPADDYYKANARLCLLVLFKLFGTVFLGLVIPFLLYWLTGRAAFDLFDNSSQFVCFFLIASGFCCFAFLLVFSELNQYVLFNYQIRHQLKTGDFIAQKVEWMGSIAYRIFAGIVLFPSLFAPPGAAFFWTMVAVVVSWFVSGFIINMELKRLGISTLFTLVNKYFEKDLQPADEFILKK